MAEEVKKIISIDAGQSITTVKELKARISELRDALVTTEKDSEDWKNTTAELVDKQTQLSNVMNAGKSSVEAATTSIKGMETAYRDLYKTYSLLSEEQRNSDFGKEMASQLQDLSQNINKSKQDVGNWQSNIGNYTNSIIAAFGKTGQAAQGMVAPIGNVTKALNVLKSHPIVAVASAFVLIIQQIVQAFKRNEEATASLKKALAPLEAVLIKVQQAFDLVVGAIGRAAEAIADFWAKLWGKNGEKDADNVVKKLQAITDKELALSKSTRENTKKNADAEKEAAELRAKAEDQNLYTAEQRLQFTQQAGELESEISQRAYEDLKTQYEIIKEKNSLTASSAEDLQKEADAYAAMVQAETAYLSKKKEINAKISSLRKEAANEATQRKNELLNLQKDLIEQELNLAEDGSDEQLRLAKDLRKKELEITLNSLKQKLKNTKDYQKAEQLARQAYNNDIEALERDNLVNAQAQEIQKWKNQMAGLREGSSEYYKALADIKRQEFDDAKKNGPNKKTGESEVDFNARLIAIKKEITALQDSALQALEIETKLANQIVLEGTRPMSEYYKTQYEQLQDFLKNLTKLENESDDEFIARQNAVQKESLDALVNYYKAWAEEQDTNTRKFRDDKYVRSIYKSSDVIEGVKEFSIEVDKVRDNQKQAWEDLHNDTLNNVLNNVKTMVNYIAEVKDITLEGLSPEEQDKLWKDNWNLLPDDLKNEYLANLEDYAYQEAEILEYRKQNWMDLAVSIGDIMGSIGDIMDESIKQRYKEGKINQKQAEDQFKTVKAFQIGQATINTISGAISAFMGCQSLGQPWGAILGAVQAAAVTAAGIAQIQKIKNTEFGSAGSSASAGGGEMAIATPIVPDYEPNTRTNLTGLDETEILSNALSETPVKAYVVESEVSAKQELADKRNNETTF